MNPEFKPQLLHMAMYLHMINVPSTWIIFLAHKEPSMRLGHDFSLSHMCNAHRAWAPCIWKCGEQVYYPAFIVGKAHTFSPNLGRNFHYKYQHSSFRTCRSELWQFKRKATLELRVSFYLLLDFLGYVFIFSNFFLVTKCNYIFKLEF